MKFANIVGAPVVYTAQLQGVECMVYRNTNY